MFFSLSPNSSKVSSEKSVNGLVFSSEKMVTLVTTLDGFEMRTRLTELGKGNTIITKKFLNKQDRIKKIMTYEKNDTKI